MRDARDSSWRKCGPGWILEHCGKRRPRRGETRHRITKFMARFTGYILDTTRSYALLFAIAASA